MTLKCLPTPVLLGVIVVSVSAAQPATPARTFAPGDIVAQQSPAADLLTGGRLVLTVGKEGRPVTADLPLTVAVTFEHVGRTVVWNVSCANTGQEPLWLELGPELLLKHTGPLTVFDGWDDLANPDKRVASDRPAGNMPLTCAWNKQATVAVGLEPSQLVSYMRHEYESLPDATARLATLTRIIVDPGKTEQVRFVTLAAPGEWGKYEAFEAYYDSFPSFFVARPDVDPRASLGGAMYSTWPASTWSPEVTRRLYGGWEWCYAPFRRTGDIACRPEFWDYQPARPFDRTRALPRDQYLAWREKGFADGNDRCDVAMMFYIPSQIWCEERLAREHYADSLTTDPRVTTYFDTPWCTGHDNELRVFPYETSFGEQSRKDIAQVASDLKLSGFAFDTAGDGARYFGSALPGLPHRAWDDQVGGYCDELVAIANLMDYVHTLKKDGKTLGVVANPMAYGTYTSCFHCDSAMLEGTPWTVSRTFSDRLRWKMGHKTLVWWEGYELEDFIDPATVTKHQLAAVYRGLADFTLLQSLRNGFIPPPFFTVGQAKLNRWMPAIVDCVQTGWQPVPAARVPEPMWASRYGSGVFTKIAVGQETAQPAQGEVAIENARLGKEVYLFSGYDGAEMTNRVVKGETLIPVEVPVRTPVLLQAQLGVTPATAVQTAQVKAEMGACGGTLTVVLNGSGAATAAVRIPRGLRIASMSVDGRPLKLPTTPKLSLKPQTTLVVNFVSNALALKDSELADFPFLKDGKANCTLVVPADASEPTRHAAFRVQEYFRYWTGRVQEPPAEVLLPIVPTGTPVQGPTVQFIIAAHTPARLTLENGNLVFRAPNEDRLLETVFETLRALDRKYWFPERLWGTVLNTRVGLAGTIVE